MTHLLMKTPHTYQSQCSTLGALSVAEGRMRVAAESGGGSEGKLPACVSVIIGVICAKASMAVVLFGSQAPMHGSAICRVSLTLQRHGIG